MTAIIIVLALILLSGFFSAAETGITTVSRARIHRLSTEGNKRAILVSDLIRQKDRTLSAILLGNSAVNITASSVATEILIRIYGDDGVIYATVIITLLVLVCGEVIPKTYAFSNAERVALAFSRSVRLVVWLLAPVTGLVQQFVNYLFRILRIKAGEENSGLEAISETIDLHHSAGEVVKQDKDMLQSILELEETSVRQVMIPRSRIISINIGRKPEHIIAEVLDNTHTRIPVWRENPDNIIGILHSKALLKEVTQAGGDFAKVNWRRALSEAWFVPETTKLKEQLFQFRQKRNHMALVVDEYGGLQGLVTLEDILEEIVGHMDDEYDKAFTGIVKEPGGSYKIEGATPVRDINRQLEWNLPDDKAATIGGLIIEQARTIPDPGEELEFSGVRFKILKKQRNQILYVRCWLIGGARALKLES